MGRGIRDPPTKSRKFRSATLHRKFLTFFLTKHAQNGIFGALWHAKIGHPHCASLLVGKGYPPPAVISFVQILGPSMVGMGLLLHRLHGGVKVLPLLSSGFGGLALILAAEMSKRRPGNINHHTAIVGD